MGKQWKQWQTLYWGDSKITAYGDCSHEIKRCLLLGRKAMTNLDSILKSRDITLPTKVHLVKALVFNILSRLVITFLPRSKRLLNHGCNHHLQWFWSPPKERQPLFPHLFPMKWWDQMPWSLFSECWVLTQLFPLSSFTFIKRLFSFFSLSV